MAQIVVVPGSRPSSLANPGEQELLSHKSSIRSSLNDAPVLGPTPTLGPVMCYHGWPGLGHVPISGARGRDQDSPKHYAPSVEGVIPQRKIGVLLPEEEGVDSGSLHNRHPLLIGHRRLL